MKMHTGVMLLAMARNIKGIITVFEKWVKREAKIGTVSISNNSANDSDVVSADD